MSAQIVQLVLHGVDAIRRILMMQLSIDHVNEEPGPNTDRAIGSARRQDPYGQVRFNDLGRIPIRNERRVAYAAGLADR